MKVKKENYYYKFIKIITIILTISIFFWKYGKKTKPY